MPSFKSIQAVHIQEEWAQNSSTSSHSAAGIIRFSNLKQALIKLQDSTGVKGMVSVLKQYETLVDTFITSGWFNSDISQDLATQQLLQFEETLLKFLSRVEKEATNNVWEIQSKVTKITEMEKKLNKKPRILPTEKEKLAMNDLVKKEDFDDILRKYMNET
jgi:hypothetical protein